MSEDPLPSSPLPEQPTRKGGRRSSLLRMLAGLLVLAIVAVVGLRLWVASRTTPASLVRQMEEVLAARVEIAETSVSLLRSPAEVRLRGLRMAPRDELANNAVPLGQRPPLEHWWVGLGDVRLEASLTSILRGRFEVSELRLAQAEMDARITKAGKWNITKLFDEPDIIDGKPNPKKKPAQPETAESTASTGGEEAAGVHADSFPIAAQVKHVLIEGGVLRAFLKKKETMVDVSGLRLEVDDLDIDPRNLAEHNRGRLRLSGMLKINKPFEKLDYAVIRIEGEGTVQPFDPASGAFNPRAQARITLGDPSAINLLPSLERIADRIKALKKFGIDVVDEVGTSVEFLPGSTVDLEFVDGQLRTVSPLRAKAGKLDIEMQPGSWLMPASNEHSFDVVLLGDEAMSKRVLEAVKEKSKMVPGAKAKEEFVAALEKSLFLDGRFRPLFTSTGDLGDPDVNLRNELPDLGHFLRGVLEDIGISPDQQKQLEEAGRNLLQNLLKKKD